jgi:hypothetical protein
MLTPPPRTVYELRRRNWRIWDHHPLPFSGQESGHAIIRSLIERPGQVSTLLLALDNWAARRALVPSRRFLGPNLGLPELSEYLLDVASDYTMGNCCTARAKGVRLSSGTVQTLPARPARARDQCAQIRRTQAADEHLAPRWRIGDEGGEPWLHFDWKERDAVSRLPN